MKLVYESMTLEKYMFWNIRLTVQIWVNGVEFSERCVIRVSVRSGCGMGLHSTNGTDCIRLAVRNGTVRK